MLRTTAGQLLVNEALPEDLRDYQRTLDRPAMNALLRQVAEKHPEKYRDISKRLADIGRRTATAAGFGSFGLEHMRKSKAGLAVQQRIDAGMRKLLDDDTLSDEQRKEKIIRLAGGEMEGQMDAVYKEALAAKNPLALQVLSGTRGNKMNLSSLLGSDLLYADHRDNVIPLPVTRSYSQGLTPAEYWSGTYGARRGLMAAKFSVQESGYLGKIMNQVSHRLVVEDDDAPEDPEQARTLRGMPVDTDDPDNEGALLAHDVGGYKRNTVLMPKILHDLSRRKQNRILVRSPIIGSAPGGGVYARDVGVRERGTLPGRGEIIGPQATQTLSEPISQGGMSAKHSGGVAGQEKSVGGFQRIEQLVQIPKTFRGGAAHSTRDGFVTRIEPAPAGGQNVSIDGEPHYVGAGYGLKVQKGDTVEAGDVISEGEPNPEAIVEHKGVGEGRRYLATAFREAMKAGGLKANRRNTELLARGLINHVRLTDELGDHVPGDVVQYAAIERSYRPRADSRTLPPGPSALGHYLERPVLHYTIGTKVRPSVLKELQHFGVEQVDVHKDPPPFEPEMIRGMANLHHDPDWMTRMYGSGLKSSLLDAVHRGSVSDEEGSSFVPGLARSVDFGRVGLTKKPVPGTKPPPEGTPFNDDLLMGKQSDAAPPGQNEAPQKAQPPSGLGPAKPPTPPAAPSALPAPTTALTPPTAPPQSLPAPTKPPAPPTVAQAAPKAPFTPLPEVPDEPKPWGGGYRGGPTALSSPDLMQAFAGGDLTAINPSAFAAILGLNRRTDGSIAAQTPYGAEQASAAQSGAGPSIASGAGDGVRAAPVPDSVAPGAIGTPGPTAAGNYLGEHGGSMLGNALNLMGTGTPMLTSALNSGGYLWDVGAGALDRGAAGAGDAMRARAGEHAQASRDMFERPYEQFAAGNVGAGALSLAHTGLQGVGRVFDPVNNLNTIGVGAKEMGGALGDVAGVPDQNVRARKLEALSLRSPNLAQYAGKALDKIQRRQADNELAKQQGRPVTPMNVWKDRATGEGLTEGELRDGLAWQQRTENPLPADRQNLTGAGLGDRVMHSAISATGNAMPDWAQEILTSGERAADIKQQTDAALSRTRQALSGAPLPQSGPRERGSNPNQPLRVPVVQPSM